MSKRETKFSASWSDKYAWISRDKNCIHSARCTLCSTPFSIRNGGISDVNQHSKTAIHVKNEKQIRSQRTFKTSANSLTGCRKPTTCSRTRKLPRNILKKKQNPDMLFNLVPLLLLKINWLLMYKSLHTPLNLTELQSPKWKRSMTDTIFLKKIMQNCNFILQFFVFWSLYGWWSSWPFFRVCEGSWIRL